jgi:hypothetical protein
MDLSIRSTASVESAFPSMSCYAPEKVIVGGCAFDYFAQQSFWELEIRREN